MDLAAEKDRISARTSLTPDKVIQAEGTPTMEIADMRGYRRRRPVLRRGMPQCHDRRQSGTRG